MRLLIIDDDTELCQLVADYLRPMDFPAFPDGVTPLIGLRSVIPADFFSPATPGSTDPALARTPDRLQHDFDIYSWETFIALCCRQMRTALRSTVTLNRKASSAYPEATDDEKYLRSESDPGMKDSKAAMAVAGPYAIACEEAKRQGTLDALREQIARELS